MEDLEDDDEDDEDDVDFDVREQQQACCASRKIKEGGGSPGEERGMDGGGVQRYSVDETITQG